MFIKMFDRGVSIFDTINKSMANFISNIEKIYIFVIRIHFKIYNII